MYQTAVHWPNSKTHQDFKVDYFIRRRSFFSPGRQLLYTPVSSFSVVYLLYHQLAHNADCVFCSEMVSPMHSRILDYVARGQTANEINGCKLLLCGDSPIQCA